MATNPHINYFDQTKELNLYKGLIEDVIKMYGINVDYLPRSYQIDDIFLEDVLSSFSTKHTVEMFIENFNGFQGDGDMLKELGLSINDQLTLIVHPDRFQNVTSMDRPLEGDLVYFGLTNGLFEIKFFEHEEPFYQLGGVTQYKLQCELFRHNQEDIDVGVSPVDAVDDQITDSIDDQGSEIESETDENKFNPDNPLGDY